jgi:hypothetical protein
MVTDKQYWRLMKQLRRGKTLKKSAAVADMDEKTARKYRDAGRPPSEARERRGYRTRADPFEGVWNEIRPLLENEPDVEASALLDWLCGKYPERFRESHLRTLQRRIKGWRAVEGPAKEVYFEQQHVAGHQAQSDFTSFNDLNVTIGRQPFGHLYYHFCLTYSNWESGSICFSESFEALSEGFQKAVGKLGRVPAEHRTDNLSAAVVKPGTDGAYTSAYLSLLDHYGLAASRSNPYSAHENGDIEQSHRRFKTAVRQALILRGHRDFTSRAEYDGFLEGVAAKRNARRMERFGEEMAKMGPLPREAAGAAPPLRSRVSRNSTVWVRNNLYSVPSRLIGQWVSVRLASESIEVWYGDSLIERMERISGRGEAAINYRHIIHSLVRKPGAFARFRHRQQMFPRFVFRLAYDRLTEICPARADREYLRILEMAALRSEELVAAVLDEMFENGREVTAAGVAAGCDRRADLPVGPAIGMAPVAVDLREYDSLLAMEVAR